MRRAFEIIRNRGLLVCVGNVSLVLQDPLTGEVVDRRDGANIITDAGDLYYAELAVAATQPTNFTTATTPFPFDGRIETWAGVTAAPAKNGTRATLTAASGTSLGIKDVTVGWPKVNDNDARNGGGGPDTVTYLADFLTGESNGTISDVVITQGDPPGASEPLLMWSDNFTPLVKTISNTLAVFVNHTSTGV